MKILINYDTKVITFEKDTTLGEIYDKVSSIIEDWRDWHIEVSNIPFLMEDEQYAGRFTWPLIGDVEYI